jgi:hypothetical protein
MVLAERMLSAELRHYLANKEGSSKLLQRQQSEEDAGVAWRAQSSNPA